VLSEEMKWNINASASNYGQDRNRCYGDVYWLRRSLAMCGGYI